MAHAGGKISAKIHGVQGSQLESFTATPTEGLLLNWKRAGRVAQHDGDVNGSCTGRPITATPASQWASSAAHPPAE